MNRNRLIVAVVVAPLAAPIATFLLPIISGRGAWPYNQADYLWIIGVSTLCAYLGFFIIGLPLYCLLKRWRMLDLFTLSTAGAVSGLFVFEFFLYIFGLILESSSGFDWTGAIWGASLGLLVALAFGLIAGVNDVKEQRNAA